jgi:hypothetical protein
MCQFHHGSAGGALLPGSGGAASCAVTAMAAARKTAAALRLEQDKMADLIFAHCFKAKTLCLQAKKA